MEMEKGEEEGMKKMEEEGNEESEESEESEDGRDRTKAHRIWALENLYKLVMTTKSLDTFPLIRLLFVVGCFETQNDPKPGTVSNEKKKITRSQFTPFISLSLLDIPESLSFMEADYLGDLANYCYPVISSEVRDKAIELLFASTRALSVKREEQDDKKGEMGLNEENELYVYLVLKEYLQLETTYSSNEKYNSLEMARTWSEGEKEVRESLLEHIETICTRYQKDPAKHKRELVFARLFVNVLLEQVFKPEYSQFIPDLVECYRQFSSPENTTQQSEERPVSVLLEIVLILLRTSSKTLRDSATQLFGGVCGEMEEEDVKDMLNVFWTNEDVEEMEEEGEDEGEGSEEEIEMSMDEEGEEEEKEEEDESDESDDDDDDDDDDDGDEESEESEEEEKKTKEKKDDDDDDDDDDSESEWENGVGSFNSFPLTSSSLRNSAKP